MILAAIGLYGVISYWVEQRTREIGIRMALGAEPSRILGMIFSEFGAVVAIGLVAGLGAAFAMTRVMDSLLFGVSATDAVTYGLLALFLAGVSMLATWIPARRALRVEPITAVRYE